MTETGFDFAPVGTVDFLGRGMSVETFFRSIPILADGYGNFWILDAEAGDPFAGPVLFWCHDPPVVVVHAATLAQFFRELFTLDVKGRSQVFVTAQEMAGRIWSAGTNLIPVTEATRLNDRDMAEFARGLPPSSLIADLRGNEPGTGFSWGKSVTDPKRHGSAALFAIEPKKPIWSRLFHRS
jgi:hypothetical protein